MSQKRSLSLSYAQAFFWYTASIKLFDALGVALAWWACWHFRFGLLAAPKGIPPFGPYEEALWPIALVFTIVFHSIGTYRADRIQWGFRSLKKLVEGSLLATMAFIATCYLVGEIDFSRIFLLLFAVFVPIPLAVIRASLDFCWRQILKAQVKRMRVLLIGDGEVLQMYYHQIEKRRPYPLDWVGYLAKEQHPHPQPFPPYLGSLESMVEVVRDQQIDRVVVALSSSNEASYADILEALSRELVDIKVIPDFGKFNTFNYQAKDECGIPFLTFNQTPVSETGKITKRVLDFLGALLILLLFSPLMAVVALAIRLTSKGPIFFSQIRVGADHRHFRMYKFRTMIENAETQTGAVWAQKNDSRTTPIGKFLRSTSLDELPQLWNVLKGEMSLVGPRPERPVFVEQFKKTYHRYQLRHKMKSGMTGWAQINGFRGNTSLEERLKYDLYYIGHWSIYFDIKILFLTIFKGFIHRHAY